MCVSVAHLITEEHSPPTLAKNAFGARGFHPRMQSVPYNRLLLPSADRKQRSAWVYSAVHDPSVSEDFFWYKSRWGVKSSWEAMV